jgi:hypothetical protein
MPSFGESAGLIHGLHIINSKIRDAAIPSIPQRQNGLKSMAAHSGTAIGFWLFRLKLFLGGYIAHAFFAVHWVVRRSLLLSIEIVLETQVIQGRSGPPRIAAVHSW